MPSTTWTAGNGSFFTAANWNNGVPTAGFDAFIAGSIGTPLLITYAGTRAINTLSMAFSTLSMTSGSLTLANASGLSGFTQSAGLVDFQNGGLNTAVSSFAGVVSQTVGTIEVDAGTLALTGGGSFAGIFSGAGVVTLGGATTYTLNTGVQLLAGGLTLGDAGTVLALATNVVQGGSLATASGTTLSLGTRVLTLQAASNASLAGLATGSGRIAAAGHTSLGAWTLGATATLANTGTVTQTNNINLGTALGSTLVQNSRVWNLAFDRGDLLAITSDGQARFSNTGTFAKIAGFGTNRIDPSFTNSSTGTISVGSGALYFVNAGNSFAGTITGSSNGTVLLGGGVQQTLLAGVVVSVPTLDIVDNGTNIVAQGPLSINRTLNQNGGTTLSLGANTLTLAASSQTSLGGVVAGSGTILAQGALGVGGGTLFQLAGSETLVNSSSITQSNFITLGSNAGTARVQNNAGAIWNITYDRGDLLDLVNGGGGQFTNAGLFEKTVGVGTNRIDTAFTNQSTGTILVAGGALYFVGQSSFAGTIAGSNNGTVLLGGSVQQTLVSGVTVTVPTLSIIDSGTNVLVQGPLSIANALNQNANTSLSLGANTLTLATTSQAGLFGFVGGTGTILAQGALTVGGGSFQLGGAETLINSGSITQSNFITVGSNAGTARVQNNAGAIWNITYDRGDLLGIVDGGGGQFVNAGLFEKTAGAGTDRIAVAFTNQATGTVQVASGGVYFVGQSSLAGRITGASGGTVTLGGGVQQSLATGVVLTVPILSIVDNNTNVTLASNIVFAGTLTESANTSITLGGRTLTLNGVGTLGGLITGGGTLLINTGKTAVTNGGTVGGSSVLDVKGSVSTASGFTLGDSATSTALLRIEGSGTVDFTGDGGIAANGTASIQNAGLLEKEGGLGNSIFSAQLNSSGTLRVDSGSVDLHNNDVFSGAIVGTGVLYLSGFATFTFNAGTTVAIATLGVGDAGQTATLNLTTSVSDAGTLTETAGSVINLGGNTLTLTGVANLGGLVTGAGTLLLNSGTTAVTNGDTVGGSATLEIRGNAAQSANNTIGDSAASTARLLITAGATYTFSGNAEIFRNGSTTLANAGTLRKTGGSGVSQVDPAVTNTGSIVVNTGSLVFANTVTNDAAATASLGSTLSFTGALTNDVGQQGTVTVVQGGTASFGGFVDAGQTLAFADTTGFAAITANDVFHATIAGFVQGDLIDVRNFALPTTKSFAAGVLTLGNATQTIHLSFSGSHTLASFTFVTDGAGGTLIGDPPVHAPSVVASPHWA